MYITTKSLMYEEILFTENFSIILKKSQLIIETPEFYNCKPSFIRMSNPMMGAPINLGNLCQLWAQGEFIEHCKICGDLLFIFAGAGNFAGTISQTQGICQSCKQIYQNSGDKEHSIYLPFFRKFWHYYNNKLFVNYKINKRLNFSDVIFKITSYN